MNMLNALKTLNVFQLFNIVTRNAELANHAGHSASQAKEVNLLLTPLNVPLPTDVLDLLKLVKNSDLFNVCLIHAQFKFKNVQAIKFVDCIFLNVENLIKSGNSIWNVYNKSQLSTLNSLDGSYVEVKTNVYDYTIACFYLCFVNKSL